MIVATPFAHAPRSRWVDDPVKQKAERLDMDIVKGLLTDSDDDDEDSQTKNNDDEEESSLVSEYDMESSLGEDDMSVSTEDSDDAEILDIEKLMIMHKAGKYGDVADFEGPVGSKKKDKAASSSSSSSSSKGNKEKSS